MLLEFHLLKELRIAQHGIDHTATRNGLRKVKRTSSKLDQIQTQSTLSNSNSLGDRKDARITNVRIADIRIIAGFGLEIFKGPENLVRISKTSNFTSSHWTELTVFLINS